MRNSIVKKISLIMCCVLIAGLVPKIIFANELCINRVYLLGNDREKALLDDTVAVEFNDFPDKAVVTDAVITVSENGEITDYSDYEIGLKLKVMYIKLHNLKKGSYYNFRISGVSSRAVDFTFKTVGFGILANRIAVDGNKVSADVKSGYSAEQEIYFFTALYDFDDRLIGSFLNAVTLSSGTDSRISFDINYSGQYDHARAFAFSDIDNITPADSTEVFGRLKTVYHQDFNSPAVDKEFLSNNIVGKGNEYSVKTDGIERFMSMKITTGNDMHFDCSLNRKMNGYIVFEFDICLQDDGDVTRLIQFFDTDGDVFIMNILPDGSAVLPDGTVTEILEKRKFNKISVCVDSYNTTADIYINDRKTAEGYPFYHNGITGFRIHSRLPNGHSEMYVDNICVYEWDSLLSEDRLDGGMRMDAESVMKNAVAMYIGKSNVLLHGRKSYISDDRTVVPYENNGKIMIPVRFFAESIGADIVNGKIVGDNASYVLENGEEYADLAVLCSVFGKKLHTEKNGIIVYSDTDMESIFDWKNNEKLMRAISESYMFDDVSGDELYNLLLEKHPSKEHPRLIMTEDRFAAIRSELSRSDCSMVLKKMFRNIKHYADGYLNMDYIPYNIPDGIRLLQVCRDKSEIMQTCAIMYNITKEEKYASRAYLEMSTAADFKDWNPYHFLDVGEMATAMGICYDLLYNWMNNEQRAHIRRAIVEKAIYPIMEDFDDLPRSRSWNWRGELADNWCFVISGVGSCGAMAIIDELEGEELAMAKRVAQQCLTDIRRALSLFAPMGAYEEGPTYWVYTMKFYAYTMRALENATGKTFGYDDVPGLKYTNRYLYAINGSVNVFNYHDAVKNDTVIPPQMLYLADKFNSYGEAQPRINLVMNTDIQESEYSYSDILYYDKKFNNEVGISAELDSYLPVSEVAAMRSGWNKDDMYVGFHCDDPISGEGHDHMDAGTFVLDAMGENFFMDLGPDDYNLPNYLQSYRVRAEGHNTVIFNPDGNYAFKYGGKASIIKHSFRSGEAFAIGNMTGVFTEDKGVESFLRGVKLDNNRSRVTVQDKIILKKPAELYWFAHTDAKITVSDDGKRAILEKNGKKLLATIAGGKDAEFTVMEAKPLPQSPAVEGQSPNSGITKLTIHIKDCKSTEICVTFVSLDDSESGQAFLPLDLWK